MRSPPSRARRGGQPGTVVCLAVLLIAVAFVAELPGDARAVSAETASVEFENVSATSSLSFVPSTFTVSPGASVHLVVTQLADFDHTFTLSSAVNVTIPSSSDSAALAAFFHANPPLVNLSLGSTPGVTFPVTFTAPSAPGTYEYICLIHFPTMTGVMTVASGSSTSGSSSLSTLELVGIGVAVGAVAVVVGLLVWSRSRSKTPPPAEPSPKR